tara:strand:+ start:553 stop:696 length:144 start_codon:yes stop_codon:yes gene_type:complete
MSDTEELKKIIKQFTHRNIYTKRSWLKVPHEELPRFMELVNKLDKQA